MRGRAVVCRRRATKRTIALRQTRRAESCLLALRHGGRSTPGKAINRANRKDHTTRAPQRAGIRLAMVR